MNNSESVLNEILKTSHLVEKSLAENYVRLINKDKIKLPSENESLFLIETNGFKIVYHHCSANLSIKNLDFHTQKDSNWFEYQKNIKEEDLNLILEFYAKNAFPIIYNYPLKNRRNFSIQTTYRFKNKWNKYVMVFERMYILEIDGRGIPSLILLKTIPLDNHIISNVTGSVIFHDGKKEFKTIVKKILNNNYPVDKLSKRENDIVELILKGYNTKVISKTLNISNNTVDTHRRNIFKKLDVHSIQELMSIVRSV